MVLALAAVLVGGPALSAAADDPIPGQDDVRRAQQHADDVADRVAAIQAQLRASQARVDAANTALSEAAEDYDYAQVKLHEAEKAADSAQAVADQAKKRLDGAQAQVGKLAAQAYRTGGQQLSGLDVLLSPKGPEDVLERASMMQILAGQRQQVMRSADSARVVANSLTAQAEQALKRRQAAAEALAKAKQVAEQRAAAAQQAVAADTKQKNRALVELASARRTSVRIERAREEGLQKQAEERREAAARAAAAAAARQAAQQPSSGSSGDSSGSSSGSTGGSSGGGGSSSGSSSAGYSAVSWAKGKLGLPYLWGGDGPGSYDCSGLVMQAWAQAGVALPHSSRLQYSSVEHISYSSLRPGDLLFFATNPANPDTIHHVTMYIGNGQMIEAPYTGAYVRIVPVRSSEAMPYAGRP